MLCGTQAQILQLALHKLQNEQSQQQQQQQQHTYQQSQSIRHNFTMPHGVVHGIECTRNAKPALTFASKSRTAPIAIRVKSSISAPDRVDCSSENESDFRKIPPFWSTITKPCTPSVLLMRCSVSSMEDWNGGWVDCSTQKSVTSTAKPNEMRSTMANITQTHTNSDAMHYYEPCCCEFNDEIRRRRNCYNNATQRRCAARSSPGRQKKNRFVRFFCLDGCFAQAICCESILVGSQRNTKCTTTHAHASTCQRHGMDGRWTDDGQPNAFFRHDDVVT